MWKQAAYLLASFSIAFVGCKSDTPAAGPSAQDHGDVPSVAKQAYIYAYAPVYMERQRRNFVSVDKDLGDGRAPTNTFGWVRQLASPALKVIVMPNNDTLYGSAWMDLSKGPLLLRIPDMKDRYFAFQFIDAFSNTFDYVGSRQTGPRGGTFAIVGPGWNGTLPSGLAGTVKAPTSTVWLIARMAIVGPQELNTVHHLQDSVKLTTLSGTVSPATNPKFAPLPAPEKLDTMTLFQIFGDVLKAYPTPEPARGLVSQFAAIGLTPDKGFDPTALSADTKTALDQGAKDGFHEIEQAKLGSSVNGWDFSMKNGRFGEDYLLRSAVAYRSLAGNVPEEAIYFNANKDASEQPLDGAHRYEMVFPKGQLPPVNAFWSLTMYDGTNFLMIENPIHRYAIGDRTPGLKYGPDGSLTFYIQNASPGHDKESNWLPAPSGSFDVHLRTYVPRQALLDGEYKLPPLKRVD